MSGGHYLRDIIHSDKVSKASRIIEKLKLTPQAVHMQAKDDVYGLYV